MSKKIILLVLIVAIVYSQCIDGQNGCTLCADVNDCQTCDNNNGYFINNANPVTCVQIDGCTEATVDDPPQCQNCDDTNYYVFNNGNPNICVQISGCQAGSLDVNPPSCIFCDNTNYYFLNTDNPATCNEIQNCTNASEDSPPVCDACEDTYFISKKTPGTCTLKITDCNTYDNQDICTACDNNKVPNSAGTECVVEQIEQSDNDDGIINCATGHETDNTKCKTCKTGFSLSTSETKCVTSVTQCSVYDDNGCSKCNDDYELDSNKACQQKKAEKANSSSALQLSLFVILFVFALAH